MGSPKPLLQAFLLADHVYADRATGKKIVAGIFQQVMSTGNHADLAPSWVYACLTGVPPKFTVQLRLVDLSTHEAVAESAVIDATHGLGRLAPHEIVLPIPRLQFGRSGVFDFELIIDGETLKGCRFEVKVGGKGVNDAEDNSA